MVSDIEINKIKIWRTWNDWVHNAWRTWTVWSETFWKLKTRGMWDLFSFMGFALFWKINFRWGMSLKSTRAKVTQLNFEADFSIEANLASKSNFQVSKFNFFSKQWYLNQLCAIKIKDVIEKWKILVVKKKSQNSKKGATLRPILKSNQRSERFYFIRY